MFYMIFRSLEVGVWKKKEKKKERKKERKKEKGWILDVRTPLPVCDILPPYYFSAVGYQMKHRFSYLIY